MERTESGKEQKVGKNRKLERTESWKEQKVGKNRKLERTESGKEQKVGKNRNWERNVEGRTRQLKLKLVAATQKDLMHVSATVFVWDMINNDITVIV